MNMRSTPSSVIKWALLLILFVSFFSVGAVERDRFSTLTECRDPRLLDFQKDAEEKIETWENVLEQIRNDNSKPVTDPDLMAASDLEIELKELRGELPSEEEGCPEFWADKKARIESRLKSLEKAIVQLNAPSVSRGYLTRNGR